MPHTQLAIDDALVATITLDRDDARNAISNAMADELLTHLASAEVQQCRIVVLRANRGAEVWCAGHDLRDLDTSNLEQDNRTLELCRRIQASPLPVIAAVEGEVYGGGLLVLLSTDIVIATPGASVTFTANRLGIPLQPHWYAYLLSVVGLHRAKELLLAAAPISAEDACRWGLYNRIVSPEKLDAALGALAEQIIACSAEALANCKQTLNTIAAQLAIPADERANMQTRNAKLLESPDVQARIAALWKAIQK